MGGGVGSPEESGQQVKTGAELLQEIDQTITVTPTLWWLGHAGFVIRFATITFYVDPCLTCPGAPPDTHEVRHADLILAAPAHPRHLDVSSVRSMLAACGRAKLVLPKSAGEA